MHRSTEQLLSTSEAAELVEKDRSTITRWVQSGRLKPAHRTSGGMLLFTRDTVEAAAERVAIEAES